MGVFDSVWFKCPNCGSEDVDEQSKAGVCCCHNYDADSVPFAIAYDINGNTIKCYDCNSEFIIQSETPFDPPKTYKMKLVISTPNPETSVATEDDKELNPD